MTNTFARALSIVGHPMLVLPLAVEMSAGALAGLAFWFTAAQHGG